jgi:hypothetical protein
MNSKEIRNIFMDIWTEELKCTLRDKLASKIKHYPEKSSEEIFNSIKNDIENEFYKNPFHKFFLEDINTTLKEIKAWKLKDFLDSKVEHKGFA